MKANMRRLSINVSDSRSIKKQVSLRGIALEPGESFVGALPLDMHRGMATLGVHGEDDRRSECQPLVDGKISVADLMAYADEFDSAPDGPYLARDFIVSLLPDVVGTEERAKHLEARASLIKQNMYTGEAS